MKDLCPAERGDQSAKPHLQCVSDCPGGCELLIRRRRASEKSAGTESAGGISGGYCPIGFGCHPPVGGRGASPIRAGEKRRNPRRPGCCPFNSSTPDLSAAPIGGRGRTADPLTELGWPARRRCEWESMEFERFAPDGGEALLAGLGDLRNGVFCKLRCSGCMLCAS